jgi:formylmethanofuran dehydrogenase subunit A
MGSAGGGGSGVIIITQNPVRLSVALAASAVTDTIADNTMKVPEVIPTRVTIDERQQLLKLGKLIYTTKAGDTFTAYHSVVFPKIVNEEDKIIYDDKVKWYEAMRVAAPIRCD